VELWVYLGILPLVIAIGAAIHRRANDRDRRLESASAPTKPAVILESGISASCWTGRKF
jgi:hypothetical protein